jgi:hypothetical protein
MNFKLIFSKRFALTVLFLSLIIVGVVSFLLVMHGRAQTDLVQDLTQLFTREGVPIKRIK